MNIRVILTSAAGTMALTTEDSDEIQDTLKIVWRKLEDAGDGTMAVFRGPASPAYRARLEGRVEDDRGELPYLEARRALRLWVGLPEMVS